MNYAGHFLRYNIEVSPMNIYPRICRYISEVESDKYIDKYIVLYQNVTYLKKTFEQNTRNI